MSADLNPIDLDATLEDVAHGNSSSLASKPPLGAGAATAAYERDLEKGALAPTSMNHVRRDSSTTSSSFYSRNVRYYYMWKGLLLAAWLGLFAALAFLRLYTMLSRVPVIIPTPAAVAAAFMKTKGIFRICLGVCALLELAGLATYVYSLRSAVCMAAITMCSSVFLSAALTKLTPDIAKGMHNVKCTLILLLFSILASINEAVGKAYLLAAMDEVLSPTGVGDTLLYFFVADLLGMLILSPILLSIDRDTITQLIYEKSHCVRWRQTTVLVAIWVFVGSIPFAFKGMDDDQYTATFFIILLPALLSAMLAGNNGVCITVAIGYAAFLGVDVLFRQAANARKKRPSILLPLQFWCISLLLCSFLMIAAYAERESYRSAYRRLKRESQRKQPRGEPGRSPGTVAGQECALILGYIWSETRKPLEKMTDLCNSMMEPDFLNSEDVESITASASLAAMAIKRSVRRVQGLLTDANDISDINSGRLILKPKPSNLYHFLDDVCRKLNLELGDREISVAVRLMPRLPEWVRMDESRLSTIIERLVLNAAEHTASQTEIVLEGAGSSPYSPSQNGQVTVDVNFTLNIPDWVCDPDEYAVVLRPYAYPASSNNDAGPLSLARANAIARLMGGQVLVFGQRNRGTVISCKVALEVVSTSTKFSGNGPPIGPPSATVKPQPLPSAIAKSMHRQVSAAMLEATRNMGDKLGSVVSLRRRSRDASHILGDKPSTLSSTPSSPLLPLEASGQIGSKVGCKTEGARGKPLRLPSEMGPGQKLVLVADDSRVNRMIMSRILKKYPQVEVHEATNGLHALELCQAFKYDIVFMDIWMPHLDGYQASFRMRHGNSYLGPIILMTADAEQLDSTIKNGVNDMLYKPIQKGDIDRTLKTYGIVPGGQVPATPLSTVQTISSVGSPEAPTQSDVMDRKSGYFDYPGPFSSHGSPPEGASSSNSRKSRDMASSISSISSISATSGRSHPRSSLQRPIQVDPILIVDDNAQSRWTLRDLLKQLAPHRAVMEAEDGAKAVALCTSGIMFALIFTELTMPGMDGDVAATKIRNMRAIGGGPP
ncbi:uncharacterized protein EV422DRAFT_189818 [Fimicolochytrium jonesii]|uniref:uncharacterized protein n=1 Tax=Fimicolochytrium jonesii TaxID=1396493 RepID=UPI0022FE126A|nr:uncharacterized protein EV422DRAFT_189818 [Fimicolochytrium jonesii]KAI8818103.1 hypothetical protein EV422DRAFT_189818 [Fimicolochytrium jonesii]